MERRASARHQANANSASENITTRGRLLKCLDCGLEAHRGAVGALNIGYLQGEDSVNGVAAHPLLLEWNGIMWEPKRPMNNQPMNALKKQEFPGFSRGGRQPS